MAQDITKQFSDKLAEAAEKQDALSSELNYERANNVMLKAENQVLKAELSELRAAYQSLLASNGMSDINVALLEAHQTKLETQLGLMVSTYNTMKASEDLNKASAVSHNRHSFIQGSNNPVVSVKAEKIATESTSPSPKH